ncbi:hypothetical protein BOTBODRAFT_559322 [Botryobasidium botryosum FD-172 SS1]|uniref:Rab-GAP TBC domain-containing protein n=1 Tax=Botryobasidium botryosum (strain FD-172 SS1) TaxID=930990 RepID=A0A067M9X0_BOTB1|nr:hypothetical protein BOTBODRAFT_559322 [Botryobasidium botryosum FD-172 SS1]
MSSFQSTTHSHPLSLGDANPPSSTRHPRRRATTNNLQSPDADDTRPVSNYFTLKHQSEERAAEIANGNHASTERWSKDGGVRGYGMGPKKQRLPLNFPPVTHEEHEHLDTDSPSLGVLWRTRDALATPTQLDPSVASAHEVSSLNAHDVPSYAADTLSTKWHVLSDDEVLAALTMFPATNSSSPHPSYNPLRLLSSALEEANRRNAQLLQRYAQLEEKEKARRRRGELLAQSMPPSEQEIARRVLDRLYCDEESVLNVELDEEGNTTLPESITEAMSESFTAMDSARSSPTPGTLLSSKRPSTPSTKASDAHSNGVLALSASPRSIASPSKAASIRSSKSEGVQSSKGKVGDWIGGWWSSKRGAPKGEDHGDESVAGIDSEAPKSHTSEGEVAPGSPSIPSTKVSAPTPVKTIRASARSVINTFYPGPTVLSSPSPRPRSLSIQSDASLLQSPTTRSIFQSLVPPGEPPQATPTLTALSPGSSIMHLPISRRTSISSTVSSFRRSPHPSHVRAIFHATRVMSSDPRSILVDQRQGTSELVARLALELVRNARDEGLTVVEPRQPPNPAPSSSLVRQNSETAIISQDTNSSASVMLGRAMTHASTPTSKVKRLSTMAALASPLFGTFKSGNRVGPPPAEAATANQPNSGGQDQQQTLKPVKKPGAGTVELESIIPELFKPPTLFLSQVRPNSSLRSPSFRPSIPYTTATRFSSSEQPLTDRYGFIYDVSSYDVSLLIKAREASSTAPACLTGIKIADQVDDDDDWPGEDGITTARKETLPTIHGRCECCESGSGSIMGEQMVFDEPSSPTLSQRSSNKDLKTSVRRRSSTISSLNPTPSKPSVSPQTLTVPARSIQSPSRDTEQPDHACSNTLRSLLSQLTDIHDKQQASQKADWDAFLKKRRNFRTTKSSAGAGTTTQPSTLSQKGGAAALLGNAKERDEDEEVTRLEGLIGVAQMGLSANKEDWREFARLVRSGIPLVYRAKVWFECSGALAAMEPGEFQELLSSHEGEKNGCLAEIEKDVVRTMPLNVFFGGDGIGVGKLRRLLQAYSWRNPGVGYCQGMNLIGSTLLLVHADEEEAFWVFTSIIENLLPPEFFSPSLLVSRACPLVLLDYVHDMLPKLYNHLEELGVDLPAITFSWFLSLFTDCLAVETLFRVWDVFFVEGMDALFRVALALLQINESELLQCDSIAAIYVHLESMTTRMWHADKLMKLQASLKPVVAHADIVKRRDAHVEALKIY